MTKTTCKIGLLCLAVGLLAGCESMGKVGETTKGWYNSAKSAVMGSDRSYIGRQVGSDLDEADAMSIGRATARALEFKKAGETVTWSNSKTGASAVITTGATKVEKRKVKTALNKGVTASPNLVLIGRAYKAKKNVNIRSGPSTRHRIVGGLAGGERVTAIGKVARSDWIMVGIDGKAIGYVFASLVKPVKKYRPELREEGDADMDMGEGVMVETMVVSTACRTVNYTVMTRDGDPARDKFRACKASDGAWEIN